MATISIPANPPLASVTPAAGAPNAERDEPRVAPDTPPVSAALAVLATTLRARKARVAVISRRATGDWAVSAILGPTQRPTAWHATMTGAALRRRADATPMALRGPLAAALRHAGERLADAAGSWRLLIDFEAQAVLGMDGAGAPIAVTPPEPRLVFHPGQTVLYRPRGGEPVPVVVRRLGKNQIQVALPDGAVRAIHRKWLVASPTESAPLDSPDRATSAALTGPVADRHTQEHPAAAHGG